MEGMLPVGKSNFHSIYDTGVLLAVILELKAGAGIKCNY